MLVGAILVYAPRGPRRTPFQVAGLLGDRAVLVAAIAGRASSRLQLTVVHIVDSQ